MGDLGKVPARCVPSWSWTATMNETPVAIASNRGTEHPGYSAKMTSTIYGPDPIILDGRTGSRYWIHHPFQFTGNSAVDERLSGYPLAVFQPSGRAPHETPVVIALQGLAAPYQWNA